MYCTSNIQYVLIKQEVNIPLMNYITLNLSNAARLSVRSAYLDFCAPLHFCSFMKTPNDCNQSIVKETF